MNTLESRRRLRDNVIELSDMGHASVSIAHRLGCGLRTVQRYRAEAGYTGYRDTKPYTPEELSFIEALLADGASFAEVARTVGRDRKTIAGKFRGKSTWTPRDGGLLRGWQKKMRREHGEKFTELLRELNA